MRSRCVFGSIAFSAACSLWTARAAAQASEPVQLRWDPWVDGAVVVAGSTSIIGMRLAANSLSPSACRWCDENGMDGSIRRSLRWDHAKAANGMSNVGGYVMLPLVAVGSTLITTSGDGREGEFWANAVVIAEATLVNMNLAEVVKLAVGRRRPYAQDLPNGSGGDPDDNVSFYSAHTSFAFSIVVATGTVATMRGYRGAGWIWPIGLPVAASVGYLRMAAEKHYFTDVVVGALVGAGVGFSVPYVFHAPRGRSSVQVVPFVGGMAIAGNW